MTIDVLKNKMVEVYRTASTDKWGQLSKFNFNLANFGLIEQIKKIINEDPKKTFSYSCYGGRFGTYYAIDINDKELQKKCYDALGKNENYIRNINSY